MGHTRQALDGSPRCQPFAFPLRTTSAGLPQMTRHYNPSIVERATRILNSKQGDYLPDEVSGPVATISLEPVVRIVRNTSRTTTGNSTIYTTPADKDFYLTGLYLSACADATNDGVLYNIQVTIDGVSQRIASLVKQTTTAFAGNMPMQFVKPIKVDRNTAITVGQSFTAGTSTVAAAVYGYTEEVTKT